MNRKEGTRYSTRLRIMQILYLTLVILVIIGYIDTREPRMLYLLMGMFLPGLVVWLKIPAKFRRKEDEQFASEERELKGK